MKRQRQEDQPEVAKVPRLVCRPSAAPSRIPDTAEEDALFRKKFLNLCAQEDKKWVEELRVLLANPCMPDLLKSEQFIMDMFMTASKEGRPWLTDLLLSHPSFGPLFWSKDCLISWAITSGGLSLCKSFRVLTHPAHNFAVQRVMLLQSGACLPVAQEPLDIWAHVFRFLCRLQSQELRPRCTAYLNQLVRIKVKLPAVHAHHRYIVFELRRKQYLTTIRKTVNTRFGVDPAGLFFIYRKKKFTNWNINLATLYIEGAEADIQLKHEAVPPS